MKISNLQGQKIPNETPIRLEKRFLLTGNIKKPQILKNFRRSFSEKRLSAEKEALSSQNAFSAEKNMKVKETPLE